MLTFFEICKKLNREFYAQNGIAIHEELIPDDLPPDHGDVVLEESKDGPNPIHVPAVDNSKPFGEEPFDWGPPSGSTHDGSKGPGGSNMDGFKL